MSDKVNTLRILNLATYNAPMIRERAGRDYVTFGEKNSYYTHLFDRSLGSVTNGACISSISNLVYGKGLTASDKSRKLLEWSNFISLFNPKEVRKMISDLVTTGQCAIQCQWQGKHKSIKAAKHLPIQTLAAEKVNEEGEIEAYYYAPDWSKVRGLADTTRVPVLGTSKEPIEVLIIKPYTAGQFYYSLPFYFSGLAWAELEEEIANYHLNNVKNGLAPSMMISMNNGIPKSEEEAAIIERNITNKLTGTSAAGKFILSFSDGKEQESTITPIELSQASEQYQFLSDESSYKILSAHKIPSPLLLGIPTKTGFSSNADELVKGSILLETYVLNPYRNLLIEGFKEIGSYNGNTLDISFESLNPFAEEEKADIEASLSKEEKTDLTDDEFNGVLDNLRGDVIDEEWELVDVREYSEDNESIDDWANSKITKLAVIKSDPNAESRLDKDLYKVRYEYNEKYSSGKSREFCKSMMKRTANGVVYRYEDITQASFQGVNKSHGHKGQNYSLFKYKGGVNCGHFWNENLYRRKTKTNGEPYKDKALSSSEEVDSIQGYNPKPNGSKESEIAPKDMPNNGHHPNYRK